MDNTHNTKYSQNGLVVTPDLISLGDRIRFTYNGILAASDAQEIYAHIGYGDTSWDNIADIKMTKTAAGFEAVFPVPKAGKLNICFKDSGNNWDNNDHMNYTFDVKNIPLNH